MAIINSVSFETGTTAEVAFVSGTVSVVTTPVRGSNIYSLRVNPTGTATGSVMLNGPTGAGVNIPTGYITVFFRYATKPTTGDEPILRPAASGAVDKSELRLNSSGQLVLYDSALSLVATGTTVLAADTWYRIDLLSSTGTSSAYEVRINGTTELSGNCNQGTGNFNECRVGKHANRNGNSVDFFYCDLRIDDAAFPTADYVYKLVYPTANGNFTAWTGGFTDVNSWSTTDDTNFITTTTLNAQESYTKSSLGVTGTINGAKVLASARRTGQATSFSLFFYSNTSTGESASIAPATSYTGYGHFRTTDPDTNTAWTVSSIDSAEIGAKFLNASSREVRITSMALLVDYTPDAAPANSAFSFGYIIA